jgi:hypothetical protein
MPNLAHVVQELRKERDQAQRRVEQMDEALKALTRIRAVRGTTTRHGGAQASGAKRRMMSAASRKRVAAAQGAHSAKWKGAQRNK